MADLATLDERIEKCKRILDSDPNSQIFAALADAHRKKGDLDKAFRICRNGLKVHDSYGSAHVVMARINLDRGLYDWAEVEAGKAVKLAGRTRSLELLLAEIFIYKGEFQSAIRILKRLHDLDPQNQQIQKLLDIARKMPEEQTVIAPSKKADERRPTEPEKTPQPSVQPIEDEETVIKKIVAEACSIPSVRGALFAKHDGLLAASEWSLNMDAERCAAIMSEVGYAVNQELVRGSFGKVESVLIETGGPAFLLIAALDGLFLIIANSTSSLGALRVKLEGTLRRFKQG